MKKLALTSLFLLNFFYAISMEKISTIALFNATSEEITAFTAKQSTSFIQMRGMHQPNIADFEPCCILPPHTEGRFQFEHTNFEALLVGYQVITFPLCHAARYIVWIDGDPPKAQLVAQVSRKLAKPPAPGKHTLKDSQSYNFMFSRDQTYPLLTFEEEVERCREYLKRSS